MESDRIGRSEVHSCKKLSMNSTCTVLFLKSLNIRPFVVIYLHIKNDTIIIVTVKNTETSIRKMRMRAPNSSVHRMSIQ